jgi:hypothetical protein
MGEQEKIMLNSLKTSAYGPEFLEYLKKMQDENFAAFRASNSEMNDIHKGFAICVDKLLNAFRQCDKEVVKQNFDNLI